MNINTSIIFLRCISLFSTSSFIQTNNLYFSKQALFLSNLYFYHVFNNIIYSSSSQHKAFIVKTQFRDIQHSPIYLTSDESISNYISHCYFKDNYIPKPKSETLVLKNKEVSSNDFINKENHRPYFIYQGGYTCGNLIIAGCLFKNCFSGDEGGGGIFVSQHENIIIHETLFDGCHSTGFAGGCCCICGKRVKYVDISILIDEHLPQADIQYCCFQNCYGANDITMGAALYIAAVDMNLNYTSSTNCSCVMRCRGAQFDIQSERPTSEHMNITNGISKFCGSMEYRNSIVGYFRFQTILNISAKFISAFPYSQMNDVAVTHCNYISNVVKKINIYDYSSLIYFGDNLIVEYLYFINNEFNEDFGYFVSRMTNKSGIITMRNCYFDNPNPNKYIKEYAIYYSCFLGNIDFTQCSLIHISLGVCVGNKTAEQLLISKTFTPSLNFTQSFDFTNSIVFSNSNVFSSSKTYTDSFLFSDSCHFSKSIYFTSSILFSTSDFFSSSFEFTKSDKFTNSNLFSKSNQFSQSQLFTDSKLFTHLPKKKSFIPIIISIIIPIVIVLIVVAFFIILFLYKRNKRKKYTYEDEITNQTKNMNEISTNTFEPNKLKFENSNDSDIDIDFWL